MSSHLLRAGISLDDFINQDYDESLTVEQMAKLRNMRRQALYEASKAIQSETALMLPASLAVEEPKIVEVPIKIRKKMARKDVWALMGPDPLDLSFTDCSHADLGDLIFNNANFVDSSMLGTSFVDSIFYECNFNLCVLEHANFSDAILRRCSFVGANLRNANLHRVIFRNMDLRCADMTHALLANYGLVRLYDVNSRLLAHFHQRPMLSRDDEVALYGPDDVGDGYTNSWASEVVEAFAPNQRDFIEKFGVEGAASLIYALSGSNPIPDWRLSVPECMAELKKRADQEKGN